jgi:hypothetical protein
MEAKKMDMNEVKAIVEAAGGHLCGNGKTFWVAKNKYVKAPGKNGYCGLWFGGTIIGHATKIEEVKAFIATDYAAELKEKPTVVSPSPAPSDPAPKVANAIVTPPKSGFGVIRMFDGKTIPANLWKVGPNGAGTPIGTTRAPGKRCSQKELANHLGILIADGEYDRIGLSGAIKAARLNGYSWKDTVPSSAPVATPKPTRHATEAPSVPTAPAPTSDIDARLTRIENIILKLEKKL